MVFTAAVIISRVLPSIYRSTSTILIEEREVPENFVSASASDYARQRIQSIKHKIQSSSKLLNIIDNYDLYPDLKGKIPTDKIVNKLRESIKLGLINTDVVDRRTGRPSEVTIAFTLSYEGKEEPEKVKKVCDGITTMFIEENRLNREMRTEETSKFLEAELSRVKMELDGVETQISTFKQEHINELPETLQTNLRNFDSVEREILLLNDQLRGLKEREGSLRTQLAGIPPNLEAQNEEDRLDELMMELTDLQSRFSDEYPDVIKVKAEIEKLKKQLNISKGYSESIKRNPDNPIYVTLAAQLSSTEIEIKSINQQIAQLIQKQDEYRQHIENTPRVEAEYRKLTINRDNIQEKVNELMKKLMESKVVQGLERNQKGEQFKLLEPAQVPQNPFKPNRMAIMLIGLVLGIGAGVCTAFILEYNDTSVRNAESLVQETSFPVLASIPDIK
jgi:polysaccharide chain length determinant protein (PEP-CTERM system associated)